MLRVLGLHPTQRNIMDSFLARPGGCITAMESVMDMMDDWDDRRWTMRPRRCLARRQRSCPYITPGWASLLDDAPLVIVRSGDDTWSVKKNEENFKRNNSEKQKITQNNKKSHTGTMKEKEQSVETTDRESSNDKKSLEKVWGYSVDVGGCDEVRAFTEDGLLIVEGRGRDSDSSVMVRHVTTLPPHVKAETLTATQKEGRLVLSHKCDAIPPSVVNIPITKTEEKTTLEGKEVFNDQRQQESDTNEAKDSSKDDDEVWAFTEGGLLVVQGHGRDNNSSVMVRNVTTLPEHVKAETLTATQKDGRLVVSHESNAIPPSGKEKD